MARWAPEETDTMAALATEVAANQGTARTVIAVDGQPGVDLERIADGLVRAFGADGVPALRAATTATDPDTIRAELVDPFRTTGTAAGVLVVTGEKLLAERLRPLWRWSLWAERDPELQVTDDQAFADYLRRDDPKAHASAVLDVADPDHPRRNWNDAC
ncbi:hypothetical protein [Curtobacterium sp. RRHDQ10]|uniref:hypothetical protein n=1 Tax=Curtobacterium phyllosphaerae TaxID=3413379 RepID=UPI003BF28E62